MYILLLGAQWVKVKKVKMVRAIKAFANTSL